MLKHLKIVSKPLLINTFVWYNMIRHLSILLAVLIITSVIKPSVSTHYCCGRIAGVKFSFSKAKPSCCIDKVQDLRWNYILNPSCCHEKSVMFTVDQNYNGSSFHFNLSPIAHYINLPSIFSSKFLLSEFRGLIADVPPDESGLDSLSVLCIFRI